jgi:hypothetical protein
MFKLPDRHDFLVLAGMALVVGGLWQVQPWLGLVVGGFFFVYIGTFTESDDQKKERP